MRHFFRSSCVGCAALFALAGGSALADGLPAARGVAAPAAPPAFTWSGFYVGGNIGGAWSDFSHTTTTLAGASETVSFDPGSWAGGVQGGYQVQRGAFVVGLEMGLTGFDLSDKKQFSGAFGPNRTREVDVDGLFTLTPRLGYAFDRSLVYFKGGYANADVFSGAAFTTNGVRIAGTNRRQDGWTIGAGFEVMVAPSISLGLDYSYVQIDPKARPASTQFNPFATTNTGRFSDIDIQLVTARINLKLGDFR